MNPFFFFPVSYVETFQASSLNSLQIFAHRLYTPHANYLCSLRKTNLLEHWSYSTWLISMYKLLLYWFCYSQCNSTWIYANPWISLCVWLALVQTASSNGPFAVQTNRVFDEWLTGLTFGLCKRLLWRGTSNCQINLSVVDPSLWWHIDGAQTLLLSELSNQTDNSTLLLFDIKKLSCSRDVYNLTSSVKKTFHTLLFSAKHCVSFCQTCWIRIFYSPPLGHILGTLITSGRVKLGNLVIHRLLIADFWAITIWKLSETGEM